MASPVRTTHIPDSPPPIEGKPKVLFPISFLKFLANAVDNANMDDFHLALKNWQILKEKDIQLPEYIDSLFSRYGNDIETLQQFTRECEAHAVEIRKACEIEKPPAAKILNYH